MPKPGSEGHGKSGHLSDRLRRKAPRRYFTLPLGIFRKLNIIVLFCFVLFLYSRANNIQMAAHMNRRALDCELNKYIPPALSFLLLFFLQGWLPLLFTFPSISKALISLLSITQPSSSHPSSM